MAHIVADRIKETTTTTGTGNVTLAGAVAAFRAFSSALANNDTTYYAIVGQTGSEWEIGLGTYVSATPALARTTVLKSSNADALVNFSAGTKDVFIAQAAGRMLNLVAESANPATPAADSLTLYSFLVGGRVLPKIIGPSGIDTCLQTAIFQNRILTYVPSTGTTGTGSGTGLGPIWNSGGTVSHPTPATTAPAISNQMRRTRYANVVTTTNQSLGIRAAAADSLNYWLGNAAGLGGFFYAARFIVELYPAATVRIFAGLTASAAAYVVASDTVLNNTCGLWHDTTDPSSGAGAFNFVTRNAATTTKQSITLANAIVAGNSYDFYMFAAPNGSTINWRLDDIVNNVSYTGSTSTTLPVNTVFMGPQCAMSNGTANVTVTTSAIGIASVYTESDR